MSSIRGFATNRRFYTCQAHTDPKEIQVIAWTINAAYDTATRANDPLVGGIPRNDLGGHAGCRLRFGPSGSLWISTGDAAQSANSQDKTSLGGKILRVNATTGAGHADNPFTSPSSPLIYSYGHRNPQGLARRPGTTQMWSVEHGPRRDDEINLLSSGGNYGWNPRKSANDSTYDESVPMTDLTEFPNAIEAKWSSGTRTLATSGGVFLDGDWWGPWEGRLAVAALAKSMLLVIGFTSSGAFESEIQRFNLTYGRLRTPMIGPDKALYLTTSNSRSDNPNADKILRVTPSLPAKWVSLSKRVLTVAENAGTNTYTVKLTSQPTNDVTVTPTSSDTSKAAVSGPLTFTTTNWNTAQTVTVTGVEDTSSIPGGRTATISHPATSADTDYTLSAGPRVTVGITENDPGVTVSKTALSVAENAGTNTYTVTLNAEPSASVTVTPASSDTSKATVSGALTFTTTTWNTAQTVTVTGVNDSLSNTGGRTATITHTTASTDSGYNALGSTPSVGVTVNDDDAVTITPTTLTVAENAGTATYTVTLKAQPSADVTMTVTSDTPANAKVHTDDEPPGTTTSLTFTQTNYDTAQTVTVTGVNDAIDNPSPRTATIRHTVSKTGGYTNVTAAGVTVTLTDDDGTSGDGNPGGSGGGSGGGGQPVDQHGNTPATATSISVGSSTPGQINARNDQDYFTITVPQAGLLVVETIGSTDTQGTLTTPDGQVLAQADSGGARQNFQVQARVAAGTYLVAVTGTGTGSYRLAVDLLVGFVDNPQPDSAQSGIGVLSGWVCEAETVEVELNGELQEAAYGTERTDTADHCGDTDNGFGLLYNWNKLGDGAHTVRVLVDGIEFATLPVTVTTLGLGDEFPRGLTGAATLADFPTEGEAVRLVWQEAQQNFALAEGPVTRSGTTRDWTWAVLGNPALGSYQSGIRVISGWVCEAEEVVVEIDGTHRLVAAYGTERADTQEQCGDTNNGFGLLWNWNKLAAGPHTIRLLVDGEEWATAAFTVTTLGEEFRRGLTGRSTIADFPGVGEAVTVEWQEAQQNFVITGVGD